MNFPLQIQDEQQFNRMVYSIAEDVANQTVDRVLLNLGLIKPELTRAQCYRMAGRTRVDNALNSNKLKCKITPDNKVLIRREDFYKWFNKK